MAYSPNDLALLWGRAGGRCAFADCPNDLIIHTTDDIVGHIAHIVARSEKGPRGDGSFPKDRLNAYDNLVLLCRHHHGEVDAPRNPYSVEDLRRIKQQHEAHVDRAIKTGIPWNSNVSQISYFNVPRLSILAALQGYQIDLSFLDGVRTCTLWASTLLAC